MKHYSDFIIHGARLARHLKGQHAPENEMAHAKRPPALARTAAMALSRLSQRMLSEGLGDDGSADHWKPDDDEGRRGLGYPPFDDDPDFFDDGAFRLKMQERWGDNYGKYDYTKGGKTDWGGEALARLIGEARSSPTSWKGEGGMKDFDEMMTKAIELCGIDVETAEDMAMKVDAMETKAMGFFALYGSSFSHIDLKDLGTFPWAGTIGPLLRAFKDRDEENCSKEEAQKASTAFLDYWLCADMDKLDFGDLVSDIQEGCQPLIDAAPEVANSAYMNVGDIDLVSTCVKTLLGDNPIGNFLRYEYDHFDKTLGCLSQLGEDLPHCVLRSRLADDETISLPLSLVKKPACLLGSTYEGLIAYACISIFVGLDECLPHIPAEDPGSYIHSPPPSCANSLFPFDSTIVTENLAGNKLPGFCAKVYEENGIFVERLQARLNYYNEHGWTVDESISETLKLEDVAVLASSWRSSLSWSEDEAASSGDITSRFNSEDEEEPPISQSGEGTWSDEERYFPHGGVVVLVGGVAVLVAVTSGLLIKSRGYGSSASGRGAESDHSDLAVDVEQQEII